MATVAAPVEAEMAGQEPALAAYETPAQRPLLNRERIQLAAIIAVFFVVGLRDALLRTFWFDELSTFYVTRTPTLREMFRAIPTDGNPPLYFLLARLTLHLPVRPELGMRLPALVAYLCAALTTYLFVRRNSGYFFGLTAMCLFLGASVHDYAVEARPYSFLLLFTGVVICSWQGWRQSGKSIYLVGITLGSVAAICSHQYGVIYAFTPIAVGEVTASLRRRRIDWAVVAASLVGCLTLILTFPPTLRGQKLLLDAIRACPVFWPHPKLSDLKYYWWMVPRPYLLLIAVTAVILTVTIALRRSLPAENADAIAAGRIPPPDLSVAVTLCLFLPLMLVVTHVGTGYFQVRYAIGCVTGISALSGMLLARFRWRHAAYLATGLMVYSLLFGILNMWLETTPNTPNPWADPVLRAGNPQEPIVVASALEFPRIWWYSDAYMRSREHYLADLPFAGQHSDILPEYSLALEHAVTPMQMDDYHDFLQTHSHFLLYCYGEPRLEWIRQRLIDSGWHLQLLQSAWRPRGGDDESQPYRELYQVSRD